MKIFLKPKDGLKVPRPDSGRALNPEGELLEHSTYWRRRLADGDVTEVEGKIIAEASQSAISEEKSSVKKGGK